MRQVVAYKRVKTIETNKTASSGHRRLQEMVVFERF